MGTPPTTPRFGSSPQREPHPAPDTLPPPRARQPKPTESPHRDLHPHTRAAGEQCRTSRPEATPPPSTSSTGKADGRGACRVRLASPAGSPSPASRSYSLHTSHIHVSAHSPGHSLQAISAGAALRRRADATGTAARLAPEGVPPPHTGPAASTDATSPPAAPSGSGTPGTNPAYTTSGRAGAGTSTGLHPSRPSARTFTPRSTPARSYPLSSPASSPPAKITGASNAAHNTTGRRCTSCRRLLITAPTLATPTTPSARTRHPFTAAHSTHDPPTQTHPAPTAHTVPDFR